MHIEFIDKLRCPNAHEDSWLVAAFYEMEGRVVIEGKLGCPVCGAEYFIRNGVAVFGEPDTSSDDTLANDPVSDSTMIAALLDLARPGMLALLAGEWARESEAVAELSGSRIIALNSLAQLRGSDAIAQIRAAFPIPLAGHSLDGIAFDRIHSTPAMITEAARLLRPRGRLLVRAEAQLSKQFHELARDNNRVVAESVGELVPLRR